MQNKSFLTKTRWLVTILLLSLGIGQMWGTDVTLTFTTDAGRAAFTPALPAPSKANSSIA